MSAREVSGLLRRWLAARVIRRDLLGCGHGRSGLDHGARVLRLAFALGAMAACLLLVPACATTGPVEEKVTEEQALAAGARAERNGDLEGALVEYVAALSGNPNSAEAHFRVARIHVHMGNADIASQAFQRALAIKPDHVGALEGFGLLMLEQGRHDLARQFLHKAAALDNTRWKTFDGLGVLSDLRSKHELAQSFFRHALELQPDRPSVLNNLGYSYYLMGDYPNAQASFERVLAIEPRNKNAWSNLSLVYTRTGKYESAVQALQKIMDAASAHYSVGYVCKMDGKLDEAEKMFRSAIELSPSYNAKAHAALEQVLSEQAKLRSKRGK